MKFDKSILKGFKQRVEEKVIEAMKRAGEDFVKEARQFSKAQGGFGDVTGNLRNSIGYFLVKDGKILHQKVNKGGLVEQAIDYIKNQFSSTKGLKIVCFAGMNYASHVEAKGYSVISSQKDGFFINLETYFEAIVKGESK